MSKRESDIQALRRLNQELSETVFTGGGHQLFHGGWSFPGYNSDKMSLGGSDRFFEMPIPDVAPEAAHVDRSEKWRDLIDTLRRSQAGGLVQALRKKQKKRKKESEKLKQSNPPSSSSPPSL